MEDAAAELDPERAEDVANSSMVNDGKDDGKEGKKKSKPRGKAIPRDFVEINRWLVDDHSEEEIHSFVMEYLDQLEEEGGGFEGLSQHVDRNDKYGAWTVRRSWPTNHGFTINTIVNCPIVNWHFS